MDTNQNLAPFLAGNEETTLHEASEPIVEEFPECVESTSNPNNLLPTSNTLPLTTPPDPNTYLVVRAGKFMLGTIAKSTLSISSYLTGGALGGLAATGTLAVIGFFYPPTALTYIPYLIARPVAFYYGFKAGAQHFAPVCYDAGIYLADVTIDGIRFGQQKVKLQADGATQLLLETTSPLYEKLKSPYTDIKIEAVLDKESFHKQIGYLLRHNKYDPKEDQLKGTEMMEIMHENHPDNQKQYQPVI